MDKKDLIKVAVVGIVAIFAIELFWMYGLNSGGPSRESVSPSKKSGLARMNATVVSYEEELVVFGNSSQIDSTAGELEREGIIAYKVSESGEQRIYRLTGQRHVFAAAERFFEKNATVLASALIQLPSEVMAYDDAGKNFTAIGTSFTYKMAPDFDAGSLMPLSGLITTNELGEVVTIGNIQIETQQGKAEIEGRVERLLGATYLIDVLWEKRAINRSILGANAAGMNYTYSERSYALSSPFPLPAAKISQISSLNLQYITNIAPERISVRNDFVNSTRFGADVGSGFVFPNSTLEVRFDAGGENETKIADLQSALGISGLPSRVQKAIVSLPQRFNYEGREYWFSGNATQIVSGEFEKDQNVTLDVSFVSLGRRIVVVNKAEVEAG